jgi:hypothetical protein
MTKKARVDINKPTAAESKKYLKALKELGGSELVTAGKKVLKAVDEGKTIKAPRRKKAKAGRVVVAAIHLPDVDPKMLMRFGGCVAGCLKYPTKVQVASCIAICMGLGVPEV